MTPTEKTALATRLRRYAVEYGRLISRGTGPMVNDLQAAAAEMETPSVDTGGAGGDVLVDAGGVGAVASIPNTDVGQILFPSERSPADLVVTAVNPADVVHPKAKP